MRVWVDPAKCQGHALCLTNAPGAFEFLDLEDRSQAVADGVDRASPDQLRTAVRECPEKAIVLEEG